MVVAYTDDFFDVLVEIRNFIAKDSLQRADEFTTKLREQIEKIVDMPYGYRKNLDADNKNVRDLFYKGYVVPFYVNKKTQTITIILIYKENLPNIDFENLKDKR